MAIPWSEVEQNPQFKSLSEQEKTQAQAQYFDEVVAPQVPQEEQEAARQQFFIEYNYKPEPEPGFVESVKEAFSGKDRTTEELEALPLIGDSPEMDNIFSGGAWKAGLGLLLTGDVEQQKSILEQSMEDVAFREDEKGNTIAMLPSGDYALQKPGISAPDVARDVCAICSFCKGGAVSQYWLQRRLSLQRFQ